MAATFSMSFAGVDFRLCPSNRQYGISFQPPSSTENDAFLVLQLESFTGTLQIRNSVITAVSPHSHDSSSNSGSCIGSEPCSKPTTNTTPATTTAMEVEPATAAAAPANVTPKISPRRPTRCTHDTTAGTATTTVTTASPVLAGESNVFSPSATEGIPIRKEKRQPEPPTVPTNVDTANTGASNSLSTTSPTTDHAEASPPKRPRFLRLRRSAAVSAVKEREAQQVAPQDPTTTTMTTTSCDETTTLSQMIFLGQTPDFSQPSMSDDYLLESGGSGCEDLPLLFTSPTMPTTLEQHQTPVAAVDVTENATGATVQDLLNEASNSTNSQDQEDGKVADDNGDEAEEEETRTVRHEAKIVETEPQDSINGKESFIRRLKSTLPLPRWGHTMTKIGDNQLLVYGGQAFESSTLPTTLSDVHVFNVSQHTWHQPVNCEGMPRQWHSATYLPKRRLLISFGGEFSDPNTRKTTTTDQVMVLDTEIMLWYPPTVTGTAPSGRSGHTASLFNNGNDLVVFGGVKGAKWLNSVSVLDTMRWRWSTPKITGAAPKPRSYHTATTICRAKKNRLVIIGGNNVDSSFDSVHVLENEEKAWRWIHPTIRGTGPSPRTGHSATLLEDNKTILVYGGWDVNASDEETIFSDCFLLDTETWVWKAGPQPAFHRYTEGSSCEQDGEKRVGHSTVLVQGQEGPEILVFGGRKPNDKFCNDVQRISLQNKSLA